MSAPAASSDRTPPTKPGVGGQPAEDSSRPVTYIPVICSLCQTRMYGTEKQVGRQIRCPDCGTRTIVPAAPAPRQSEERVTSASPEWDDDEPLELEPPIERTAAEVPPAPQPLESPDSVVAKIPEPVELPRWPLLKGIFGFWFYRGSRARWFGLSAVAAGILVLLCQALATAAVVGPVSWFLSMFFTAVTSVLAICWIVAMASHGLAILHDTSYGYDDIINWPDAVWIDWVLQAFYIINSLAISFFIGAGAAAMTDGLEHADVAIAIATVVMVFPISLLSMLEAGSCIVPLTATVLRSLFRAPLAWAMFFLEGWFVAATAVGAVWLPLHTRSSLLSVLTAPILVAALMVYFRLLGRLARVCDARLAVAPPTEEATATGTKMRDTR